MYGLRDGGHGATGLIDPCRPGIIRRQRFAHIAAVTREELFEKLRARLNVLFRIEWIGHAELLAGGGHELHKALGALDRNRARPRARFLADDAAEQVRRNVLPAGRLLDQTLEL